VPAALWQPFTVTRMEYVPDAAAVAFDIVGFCNEDEKPLGPVHEYVAPVTVGVVSVNEDPAHIGPLLVAVGVAGTAFTVAVVLAVELVQPFTVTVTEYVPDAAVVAEGIDGFCNDDVKPFGPVHEYVAPPTFDAVRFNVEPVQTGPLLETVGAPGMAFTVAVVVPAAL
jgi:hypothetical protein